MCPVAIVDKWRPPSARVVAVRTFYLQYVRAKIPEELSGPRAGQNSGQFKDP